MRPPVYCLILILVFSAHVVRAESASTTIEAARVSGVIPRETTPVCTNEPESSTESFTERYLNGKTVTEYFGGDEDDCLKKNGLLRNGEIKNEFRTNARDLNNFFGHCDFKMSGPFRDIGQISMQLNLNNRDTLVNGFWQSLAQRSRDQISCRQNTLAIYLPSQNAAENAKNAPLKNQLNAKAAASFEKVVDRIRALIVLKKGSTRKNQTAVNKQYDCTGLAYIFCSQVSAARTDIDLQNYEAAIAAEVAKVPFGYEPTVAEAVVSMAESGRFDTNRYQQAMRGAWQKYSDLGNYYDERKQGGNYCIDREFKEKAVTSGVADKLLKAYSGNRIPAPKVAALQCHLHSKYQTAPDNVDSVRNGVFMVGGTAAALLTALPTEGSSLAAWGAVASAGLSVTSFASQVQKAHAACSTRDFVISPTGREQCNPEQDFEKEVNQYSLGSCLTQSGLAAFEALPIPAEVSAFMKARRAVATDALVSEAESLLNGERRGLAQAADGAEDEIVVTAPKRGRSAARTANASIERDFGSLIRTSGENHDALVRQISDLEKAGVEPDQIREAILNAKCEVR